MIIARSSQPEVGWFCWRSPEDEELLRKMSEACFVGRSQAKQVGIFFIARRFFVSVNYIILTAKNYTASSVGCDPSW